MQNEPDTSLLPLVELASTDQPRIWLNIWLRHIAYYSRTPLEDLSKFLEGLQSTSFAFYAPKESMQLNQMTPVGIYVPANASLKTPQQLGPAIPIPRELAHVGRVLLLLQTQERDFHWIALGDHNAEENTDILHAIKVDNAAMPFPAGLIKHLPVPDGFLEIPDFPPSLEKRFGHQAPEIILDSTLLTDTPVNAFFLRLLPPTEIAQFKIRSLKLRAYYMHKRLKYELVCELGRTSGLNGDVVHSLKGSIPWAEVNEHTLQSKVAELVGTYAQTTLLRRACINAGHRPKDSNSLEIVQTPLFSFYWRWSTKGVISILDLLSTDPTYAAELFAIPNDSSLASVAPKNETPEATVQRIQSLLRQLQQFFADHQRAQLAC